MTCPTLAGPLMNPVGAVIHPGKDEKERFSDYNICSFPLTHQFQAISDKKEINSPISFKVNKPNRLIPVLSLSG